MTTLRELTAYGQWLILNEFKKDLKDWKKYSYWWKGLETDTHKKMLNWFKESMKFRRSVLDGAEIENSLKEWVGYDINSPEFVNKCNVPQYSFREKFQKALKEKQAYDLQTLS